MFSFFLYGTFCSIKLLGAQASGSHLLQYSVGLTTQRVRDKWLWKVSAALTRKTYVFSASLISCFYHQNRSRAHLLVCLYIYQLPQPMPYNIKNKQKQQMYQYMLLAKCQEVIKYCSYIKEYNLNIYLCTAVMNEPAEPQVLL